MPHQWEKVPDSVPDVPGLTEPRKSDVHLCKRCHQIALSEVGDPADDRLFGLVDDFDLSVVKHVLKS